MLEKLPIDAALTFRCAIDSERLDSYLASIFDAKLRPFLVGWNFGCKI